MTEQSNTLLQALGLSNMIENNHLPVVVEENGKENISKDFDKVRGNLKALANTSMTVVNELYDLAKASESDKYYRVLGENIKIAIDANRALMDAHLTVREATVINQPIEQQNITNQLFVGSTADLQDIFEKMKNGEEIKRIN